jgi:hypothetical protein
MGTATAKPPHEIRGFFSREAQARCMQQALMLTQYHSMTHAASGDDARAMPRARNEVACLRQICARVQKQQALLLCRLFLSPLL